MTACEAAGDLIERQLDGTASADEERRLAAHLAACPACAALLAAERAIDTALAARFAGVAAPPSLAVRVRQSVEKGAREPAGWAWLPDALNALGLIGAAGFALPALDTAIDGWSLVAAGAALLLAAYPLCASSVLEGPGPA